MDRTSTDFQSLLHHFYKTVEATDSLERTLKYAQLVVYRYVKAVLEGKIKHRARGLILNHKMGVGKTILAQALAQLFTKDGYKVIVIGPKALKRNFEQNLEKFEQLSGVKLLDKFTYLTMKAGNLPDQLFETLGETASGQLKLPLVFRNSVVLIDEAHIFFNSVAHGRSVACQVYDGIMNATDCFVIPITGTMIVNSPFESVPALNIVKGEPYFPENKMEFDLYFGSTELIEKNAGRLQDMVTGLITYAETNEADSPKELRTKIVSLPMEEEQYNEYTVARMEELEETRRNMTRKSKPPTGRFASDDSGSSTYRVYTRMLSNGVNKWRWMAEKIMSNPRKLGLFQFYFVNRGGIWDFINHLQEYDKFCELIVDRNGNITTRKPGETPKPATLKTLDPNLIYFGLYHGDVDQRDRDKLIEIYTNSENKHGKYCAALLTSSTGIVGLDLKNVRYVVQVSPGWQPEDFNQLKFRAIRYKSHIDLPEDERTVQPYILVSSKPGIINDEAAITHVMDTTDEELLRKCLTKMKQNNSYTAVLRGVTLECLAGVSKSPDCRTCMANNQQLLTGKFSHDIRLTSNCYSLPDITSLEHLDPAELKKTLTQIGLTDGKYFYEVYYSKNPLRLYIYDPAIEKLISMSILHPLYDKVLELIK